MLLSKEAYDRDCVMRGIRLYWRTLGRARNMCHHTGDIEYVMTIPRGGPERIFDIHLSAGTAQERIAAIASDMKAGKIPDSILVPLDPEPPDLVERLRQNGFALESSGLCMVMDLKDLAEIPQPASGIQVEVVKDLQRLRPWVDIVNVALAGSELMSFDQFSDLYSLEYTEFFLACYQGVPAAVAMIMMEHELASLEMVATLEAYRRRGLGSAVTLAALKAMQAHGIKTATLRAEPDGINVYRGAGFREVCPRLVAFPKPTTAGD